MFIFGDILITIAKVTHLILGFYQVVIIAAVILTWIKPNPSHETIIKIIALLHKLTDPVFNWMRGWITIKFGRPPVYAEFDLTPVLVWLAVFIVDSFSYMIMMHLGLRLSMGFIGPDVI